MSEDIRKTEPVDAYFNSEGVAIIEPVKGTMKFYTQATKYSKVLDSSGNDTGEVRDTGPYTSEKLLNSKQLYSGATWDNNKRRFIYNQSIFPDDELLKVIPKFYFKYFKGNRKGEIIREADPYNLDCQFFNNPQLKIVMKEGKKRLERGVLVERLQLACRMVDNDFRKVGDSKQNIRSLTAKYQITDELSNARRDLEKIDQEIMAIQMFDALSHDKRVKIGLALNLGVDHNTDPEMLRKIMYDKIKDTSDKFKDGETMQDMFIKMASLSPEKLHIQYTIGAAIRKGIIRHTKKGGYKAFGEDLGKSRAVVEDFFSDPENQHYLEKVKLSLPDD